MSRHVLLCHVSRVMSCSSVAFMSTLVMFPGMHHYWCFMCNYPAILFPHDNKTGLWLHPAQRNIQSISCMLDLCGQGYRYRMKTPVTESKPSEWDVGSNNERDSVRLQPLPSTHHPAHPGTVQNGSTVVIKHIHDKLRVDVRKLSIRMCFNFIFYTSSMFKGMKWIAHSVTLASRFSCSYRCPGENYK